MRRSWWKQRLTSCHNSNNVQALYSGAVQKVLFITCQNLVVQCRCCQSSSALVCNQRTPYDICRTKTSQDGWVSEWVDSERHISTIRLHSAIHVGLCRKIRDKREIKIQRIQKLNITQKKQITQNTAKQNYHDLVTFYDTRPGNEVGLFYNAPEHTWHAKMVKNLNLNQV